MKDANIGPGQTVVVPYDLYGPYNAVTVRVRGRVAALVDAYVVNEDGLTRFRQGVGFPTWLGGTGRRDHHLSKLLPAGRWYLLLRNPAAQRTITVDYELSSAPWMPPPATPTGMTGSFG